MSALGPATPEAVGLPRAEDAAALAALVRETVAAGLEREALHLRLGPLAPWLRRAHHHRLLREALAPLERPHRARVFALPNGDLVALAPPGNAHLRAAAETLGALLPEAPPALLRLPRQAAALLAALEAALAPAPAPEPPAGGAGAGAADLAALERTLGTASLAAFLRCRPVLHLPPEGGVSEPRWTEWRLALPELWAALLPGLDPAASPGLARRLRGVLDRRLLAELARPEEARRLGAAGLSLGLAAIASPEFRRLDAALGREGRAALRLGLPAAEALADPEGFLAAAALCRGRGYRLVLEAEGPAVAALLAPERLGVEAVRLPFSPALAAAGLPPSLPPGRVVLAGVDRAGGIGWGWEAGITLFEGRLLRG
ncbi:hypothetical protein [Crenalkalicoccus roseus]|uniref:hypothetical protein n=1 Tax=Crenalkalicoccus roseus TaxID=1485588 RepID=UPI00108205D0|nr:hypothetical protein [Crenalkalicoccus roseus]